MTSKETKDNIVVCCNCEKNYVELTRPKRNDGYGEYYVCEACKQYLLESGFTEPEIIKNTFTRNQIKMRHNLLSVEDIEKLAAANKKKKAEIK